MEFEFTDGFIMMISGIGGAALLFIAAILYFMLSGRKAKKLLKKLDEEI